MAKRINVGPRKLKKKNYRRGGKVWPKKCANFCGKKKSRLKNKYVEKKNLTKQNLQSALAMEKIPKINKRRAFNKAIGSGKKY